MFLQYQAFLCLRGWTWCGETHMVLTFHISLTSHILSNWIIFFLHSLTVFMLGRLNILVHRGSNLPFSVFRGEPDLGNLRYNHFQYNILHIVFILIIEVYSIYSLNVVLHMFYSWNVLWKCCITWELYKCKWWMFIQSSNIFIVFRGEPSDGKRTLWLHFVLHVFQKTNLIMMNTLLVLFYRRGVVLLVWFWCIHLKWTWNK